MSRILFLLPDRELAPGESSTREIGVPVRENGRQSDPPVNAEITLAGYDEDGTGEVARFEVTLTRREPEVDGSAPTKFDEVAEK